jgi:hypothetical protein
MMILTNVSARGSSKKEIYASENTTLAETPAGRSQQGKPLQ